MKALPCARPPPNSPISSVTLSIAINERATSRVAGRSSRRLERHRMKALWAGLVIWEHHSKDFCCEGIQSPTCIGLLIASTGLQYVSTWVVEKVIGFTPQYDNICTFRPQQSLTPCRGAAA